MTGFDDLILHVGHKIVCVTYGKKRIINVAIECETCNEVLLDYDVGHMVISTSTEEYRAERARRKLVNRSQKPVRNKEDVERMKDLIRQNIPMYQYHVEDMDYDELVAEVKKINKRKEKK